MPKAKKLKSGSWRCRVVDHYEKVDGTRKAVMHSITVADPSYHGKKKCEYLAAQWQASRHEDGLRIGPAIDRYIESKKDVLSPSTLRTYKGLRKNAYTSIEALRLSTLTQERLQKWVGTFSRTHSPKTVRNAVGLLSGAYNMFDERMPRVTLPQKNPPELSTPTDAEIRLLLKEVEGTELWKAIVIAAFGTLRRGEVCALMAEDLKGDEITVRRSVVAGEDGKLVTKAPKTPQSVRTVVLPHSIAEKLRRPSGPLVDLTPSALSCQFSKVRDRLGFDFRFHDLRAYSASVRHALGIPDVYIMKAGGWKTDTVLKQVYRRAMEDHTDEFTGRATEHFEELLHG